MSRRGSLLFAAMCVLWGIPYLLIRVAGRELAPLDVVVIRAGIGALVLVPLSAKRGELRGVRRQPALVLGFAFVEIAIPFSLIAYGERHLASSLSGLLVAAVPLCVALLAIRFDDTERVTGPRLLGLAVGLGGVALLLGLDVGGDGQALLAAAAILGAAVSYAAGALIIKRSAGVLPPTGLAASGLTVATLTLAVPAAFTAPRHMPSGEVIAAVVTLGLVCTALALVVFGALIAEVGAGRATVITYVNPVVALVLGVALLGEHVGAATIPGFLLIVGGSFLATRASAPRPSLGEQQIELPAEFSDERHGVSLL